MVIRNLKGLASSVNWIPFLTLIAARAFILRQFMTLHRDHEKQSSHKNDYQGLKQFTRVTPFYFQDSC